MYQRCFFFLLSFFSLIIFFVVFMFLDGMILLCAVYMDEIGNQIIDAGSRNIADALRENSSLLRLDLGGKYSFVSI